MGHGTRRDAISERLRQHPRLRRTLLFFPSLVRRAENRGLDYPTRLSVSGPNVTTLDFIQTTGCRVIGEIGIYNGDTSLGFARFLGGDGELHVFDFEERVAKVKQRLEDEGYSNVVGHGTSHRTYDSYNWALMDLLRQWPEPRFDYVFIDGAHTWFHDALAFLLVDRLLTPGGYVDFDDHLWTLAGSPSLNPVAFPKTSEDFTQEQIDARQVELILDLLVRRDGRYQEVVPNKIFQKSNAAL